MLAVRASLPSAAAASRLPNNLFPSRSSRCASSSPLSFSPPASPRNNHSRRHHGRPVLPGREAQFVATAHAAAARRHHAIWRRVQGLHARGAARRCSPRARWYGWRRLPLYEGILRVVKRSSRRGLSRRGAAAANAKIERLHAG